MSTHWRAQRLPRERLLSPFGWAMVGCIAFWIACGIAGFML